MSSSDGRKVVRKCQVPSTCPNPLPGTTTIPVASSSFMQYSASGAILPLAVASATNFSGRETLGNAYIAPCASLQVTPSSALRPETSLSALRLSDERIASRSAA